MTLRTLLDRFDLLMDTPESVPKLRRFILQLAVRGRLTERRSSDTPAEELLDPIRSEKKRLYDDGTIRKSQAKLPELAKNGESLPNGWISIELERAGVVNPRHDADEDTKASFVPMKRIEDGVGDGHTTEIRPWGEIRRGYTHFMEGDVGLAKITPCFQNRKSTVFRDLENGMGAGTTELYVFRPLAGTILPEFVLSFFQSQGFIEEGVSRMTGTAGQKRVPREYVEQSLLPLPPLEEQQRIVEAVDRLMDECDALEEQQERERTLQVQVGTAATEALQSAEDAEALRPAWERVREHFDTVTATPEGVDALRQTILQLAVQGRLTKRDPADTPADVLLEQIQEEKQRLYDAGEIRKPKDSSPVEDEPFKLPPGWQWSRVNDICEIRGGIQKTPDREPQNNPYPYLRVANVQRNKLVLDEIKHFELYEGDLEKWRLQYGDILVVEGNGSESEIGRCAMWREEIPDCVHQNHLIRCRSIKTDMARYIMLYLNSAYGIEEMKQRAVTTSGLYNLSVGKIRSIAIPIPPLNEQKRILEKATPLRSVCNDLEDLLSDSAEHGEQLLKAALKDASVDRPDAVPADATA
ncbi:MULTISPECIES: restriction endonuclease subunit S [Salinibacter]|uniref:restriction endonuclease subunit S n=1 Tax=Salinibacter TaxID=146918 RepID=UPI0021E73BA6|nr:MULTISPECIES: restriction endonuclease subunit S [Salinibacter]